MDRDRSHPKQLMAAFACGFVIALSLLDGAQSQEKKSMSDDPRPTPVTRPEMKRLLEEMKQRTERISLPPLTESEKTEPDPRLQTYEGRLGQLYLPSSAGARGYLNFSGSAKRTPSSANNNRPFLEEDPALTLDYGFKTRLFWIASRANNCQYCLGHQESKLLAVGMLEDQLASLDSDWSSFPIEEQVAFAFARRLTLEPHLLSNDDIARCKKYYTDLQILEMALSVGGNNAINRWKEGVGVPQSSTGGNFGSPNREGGDSHPHSYLTETSESFSRKKSSVVAQASGAAESALLPTRFDRASDLLRMRVDQGLAECRKRSPRLPVASDERTREVFGDLVPRDKIPGWMKLLANFPIAGKRQVTGFVALEQQLDLSPVLRAQMSWVIARQNAAWYSLSEAERRLIDLGQTAEQIAGLENFQDPSSKVGLQSKDRSLLIVAKHLAASPVVLTDRQFSEAVQLAGPKEVVQTVHYTAMRSLFDRFTEAAALQADTVGTR